MKRNKLKSCCFILPYFGKMPNYFSLFLKSCSTNQDFNWLVITDDHTEYEYPPNVKVIYMTFKQLQVKVSNKFDFPIVLNSPYKLCDYKPAYGYIFEEYIDDYLFWGHCDADLVLGNLSKFITNQLLDNYDKLFCLGHMTLYRNTFNINRLFMSEYKGKALYEDVFTTNVISWFDEEYNDDNNINSIFHSKGQRIFSSDMSLNINLNFFRFHKCTYIGKITEHSPHGYVTEQYKKGVYIWDNGNIVRFINSKEDSLIKQEFMYMHLQSRKMKIGSNILEDDRWQILPNKFVKIKVNEISKNTFHKLKKSEITVFTILLGLRLFVRRNKKFLKVFRSQPSLNVD